MRPIKNLFRQEVSPLSDGKKGNQEFGGSIKNLTSLEIPSLPGVEKRIVFGPGRFWEDYVVRHFTVEPEASTPFHNHDWPHYIIVLEGTAEALIMGETLRLEAGSWAYVPPDSDHGFRNIGEGPLSFLCIVPRRGDPDADRQGFLERS
ncbi:MAG: cupin domain-containing protein [Thermovirgaceae bacterium]